MKYIYKLFYKDLYKGLGQFGEPVFERIPVGGNFLADTDPENPSTFLKISPSEILDKYRDRKHANDLYMSSFFSGGDAVKTGYIGDWNDAIRNMAKIYYIMTDNGPCEMFIVPFNGLSFSNMNGVQYVCNLGGKMMDCYPEEGDILFDNLEETQEYYKNVYIHIAREHAREEARKELEAIQAQYKKPTIPITKLGDGVFIGQQGGNIFYYQGNEYKCPKYIDDPMRKNVIIEIKDGKVSYREWETSV